MKPNESPRGTEWKVGLFVLTGLLVLAGLAIKFGKLGTGYSRSYTLTVEFENASGLIKGNSVFLAGAPVGFALEGPSLLPDRFAVKVPLKVREGVRIPKSARFVVGSAGLMGDAYIGVSVPDGANFEDIYKDGDYIMGTREKGLTDLAPDASDTLLELKKRLVEFKAVLSEENMKNLTETFSNLRDLSQQLKDTSEDLDIVVDKAKTASGSLDEVMTGAKKVVAKVDDAADGLKPILAKVDSAAAGLKPVLSSFEKTADSATKAVDSARSLLTKANNGQGTLGLLMADKETSENLKSLIRNLKSHGILWYKDKP
jgi:phospholipid/cholesterol/gamma-HCH transport system substrate-binding protein